MTTAANAALMFLEPRWDLKHNPLPGVPIYLVPGEGCEKLSARHCGNLPRCYRCQKVIERHLWFYSVDARYVTPQPHYDITVNYVYGGTTRAARATFCEPCGFKLNLGAFLPERRDAS